MNANEFCVPELPCSVAGVIPRAEAHLPRVGPVIFMNINSDSEQYAGWLVTGPRNNMGGKEEWLRRSNIHFDSE